MLGCVCWRDRVCVGSNLTLDCFLDNLSVYTLLQTPNLLPLKLCYCDRLFFVAPHLASHIFDKAEATKYYFFFTSKTPH